LATRALNNNPQIAILRRSLSAPPDSNSETAFPAPQTQTAVTDSKMGDVDEMADPGGESAAPKKRTAPASVSEVNVILECEKVLERLKLLNYESEFCAARNFKPLTRTFFAMPSSNPNEQFYYFTSLVSWLLQFVGRNFPPPSQYDDPTATAGTIMQELKAVKLPADFPPNKIKQGHGEVVVVVLDALLDASLEASGFKFGRPVQRQDEYDDDAPEEADAELGDEIDDNLDVEEEEGLYMEGVASPGAADEETSIRHEVIESAIDPKVWMLELERVAPLLKSATGEVDHKEWRTHLEQTKVEKEKISKVLPETTSNLQQLAKDVEEALKEVSNRERGINESFEHQIKKYRANNEEMNEAKQKYEQSAEAVNNLTNNLSTISEELDDVKNQMDDRGSSMTDTSPVVKMKKALAQVKQDTKQMDLRIGVVQHVLHHARTARNSNQEHLASNFNRGPALIDDDDDDE